MQVNVVKEMYQGMQSRENLPKVGKRRLSRMAPEGVILNQSPKGEYE